jgi:predicted enzyme related to lactoylglutathione lyase
VIRRLDTITIHSENPSELAKFYQETVGLNEPMEAEIGEGDNAFLFEMEGTTLAIVSDPKIRGNNPQPERVVFNLEVSNIDEDVERVAKSGAKKVTDTYHIEGYGFVATFEDPDGNYFQLVQVRAEE